MPVRNPRSPLCSKVGKKDFCIREDTHKKMFFFSGRTTKDLPSIHQWLSGPCHFFFFLSYNGWNGFWQFFLFLPNFWLVVRGVYPPYTLSRPTTKTFFFLCVSSLSPKQAVIVYYYCKQGGWLLNHLFRRILLFEIHWRIFLL